MLISGLLFTVNVAFVLFNVVLNLADENVELIYHVSIHCRKGFAV